MGKTVVYYFILILAAVGTVGFFFVRNFNYADPYDENMINPVTVSVKTPHEDPGGFQGEYAVIPADTEIQAEGFQDSCYAALLTDDSTRTPLVAHNVFRRIYPASTTKLMTAVLVAEAVESGKISLDDQVTLSHPVVITEEGALVSQLTTGCTISVRNLLHGLLIRSYNDYAVILAEYTAGSVEAFVEEMNLKAQAIGATGCHFMNPHGLHDDNHYITAYDMYLIISEASKHQIIRDIDTLKTYSYTYTDAAGNTVGDDITPTNQFLAGNYSLPSNISILDWKTGTTELAGNVLTMRFSISGKTYTLFAADGISQDDLYQKILNLFNLTQK